jgi:hypothetical protein
MFLHPRSKDRPFHLGPFPLEALPPPVNAAVEREIAVANPYKWPRAILLCVVTSNQKRVWCSPKTRVDNIPSASVPIPKFATVRGKLGSELRNRRTPY